jgi:hypothetical protein
MAGLNPAIYVFLGFGDLGGQDVDARNKSGQGVLAAASWLAPLDPTLFQLLKRTAVGLTRQSYWRHRGARWRGSRVEPGHDDKVVGEVQ